MPGRNGARRVFLLAGEVSGDAHGGDLARELLALDAAVDLEGVGGPRMASAGVRILEDATAWGVMGWWEAAQHLPAFLRRLRTITARLLADPPDLLVLIDFPGFNLEVLKRVRGRVRAVYYVPPMVTVRRGRRAARVAALGARLLAIFPFEAEAYRRAGADVVFVGHPAVDLQTTAAAPEVARSRLGVAASAPVVGLLPGSRRQELHALLDRMLDAARRIQRAQPSAVFLLALASPIFRDAVTAALRSAGVAVTVVDGARDVMAASTVLLMASGTAAVEAMVLGVPMVVTYRGSWVSYGIAHLALATRWAAIPNIMAGQTVVPELLQAQATSEKMSEAVLALLADSEARGRMQARLRTLAVALGEPGAPRRAAAEVLAALGPVRLNAASAVE
jgi:lipid-A-disaccharide synthase